MKWIFSKINSCVCREGSISGKFQSNVVTLKKKRKKKRKRTRLCTTPAVEFRSYELYLFEILITRLNEFLLLEYYTNEKSVVERTFITWTPIIQFIYRVLLC